jgi:Holliday junction resolvase RusA-like endonuclease
MREASVYLSAWRAAVKKAAYKQYQAEGIKPVQLPLYRGPVVVQVTFRLDTGRRIDSMPDLDKLLRSTWDALTAARVWEDDGRVIAVAASKRAVLVGETAGADIEVWQES